MASLKIKQQVKNFKLCLEHYQELYRQLVGARPCASCNIKPQKGTHFTRYSPNSDLINCILGVAELDGTEPLTSTDYICNTCYKLHVAILKSHENENELADLIQSGRLLCPMRQVNLLLLSFIQFILWQICSKTTELYFFHKYAEFSSRNISLLTTLWRTQSIFWKITKEQPNLHRDGC